MPDDPRADAQDIADVLVRYATGIDRRDWPRFRTCFTEDVHADYEDVGTWDGVDAITEFMTEAHADLGHTLHRITNIAVEVDGDRATARSYVDAVIMLNDGVTGVNPTGWYDDDLVRTPDGWRIARRHCTIVRLGSIGG